MIFLVSSAKLSFASLNFLGHSVMVFENASTQALGCCVTNTGTTLYLVAFSLLGWHILLLNGTCLLSHPLTLGCDMQTLLAAILVTVVLLLSLLQDTALVHNVTRILVHMLICSVLLISLTLLVFGCCLLSVSSCFQCISCQDSPTLLSACTPCILMSLLSSVNGGTPLMTLVSCCFDQVCLPTPALLLLLGICPGTSTLFLHTWPRCWLGLLTSDFCKRCQRHLPC